MANNLGIDMFQFLPGNHSYFASLFPGKPGLTVRSICTPRSVYPDATPSKGDS
ncbi:hypothetical protein [Citrobacter europaeus]|uniref:hypothetical protein n=1 Tax=Citrobacter europaeus TaxID=1914243 RepID=UPI0019027E65|nr:hypothetical protein [Citrobacter freundii]